jgi:hypothetical protein
MNVILKALTADAFARPKEIRRLINKWYNNNQNNRNKKLRIVRILPCYPSIEMV